VRFPRSHSLAVDFVYGSLTSSFTESNKKKLVDPGNEMVFKDALNDLMQKIGRENLVNICAREVEREWLGV
jgi:hypothetical protein